MTGCTLILPGAGFARRMRGADKLLQPVNGAPVVQVLAKRGLQAGLAVRVTVPSLTHGRAAALAGLDVEILAVPAAQEGMAASFRVAFQGLETPTAMVLPADMPEITVSDLQRMAEAKGQIVRACAEDGTPGHPVRFDQRYFEDLTALTGDTGARAVLRRHASDVVLCPLPARHALTDLDTPEDWADWQARQSN